jgi:uroporphyrinogen III methyltransferase/synthase
MIVVGEVVTLRSRLRFLEKQPLFGRRYLVPKIGKDHSRLAEMLRGKGAEVTEIMVGEIVGIPADYTYTSLNQTDMIIFTSANGVRYFMRNLFASELDTRALGNAKIIAIGPKTADRLKEYGIVADMMPESSNGKALAEELRVYSEIHCRETPFKRPSAWYPTAKNADDDLVDSLLEFCDCGRLNVYENIPCEISESDIGDPAAYDGIIFTSASCAERLLRHVDEESLTILGTETTIYSIGPKCSAALSALGVTPISEAPVSTYEGIYNMILRK